MIKKYHNSRIEIWSNEYINNTEDCPRNEEDSEDKVFIGQIEHGYDDESSAYDAVRPRSLRPGLPLKDHPLSYIVEVVPVGCGLINFGT